jgi:hypothetical protein
MRDLDRGWEVAGERIFGHPGTIIDAGAFLRQPLPLDAVEMQHGRVRGKARPDGRACVGLRPVDEIGEFPPVALLRQGRRDRLGAGDDQTVDLQAI